MEPAHTLPLTVLEEAILHLETTGPWNIQLEVGASGRLDDMRLGEAVALACIRHPMARARMAPWTAQDRVYNWDIAEKLDYEPLRVADAGDDKVLGAIRSELYSPPIPLDASPPLRAVLVRRHGGDLLLVNLSHVVTDGVGSVRILQSIARAYHGDADPPDPVSLPEARDLGIAVGARSIGERLERAFENLRRVRDALDAPTRIAVVGGSRRDGFGFVTRRLASDEVGRLLAAKPAGSTLNDALLAALHLAIDRWNREHGEESGRIGLMMPVNGRPADRLWEVVSNFAFFVTVSTAASQRKDLASTTSAVAEQTSRLKRSGATASLFDLLEHAPKLRVDVKRAMPMLLPLTGDRFIDSAVLSNLGRIPSPPSFEEDEAEPPELWFSPPCRMPLGVGVGAATVGGVLHLVVRHRWEQFDTPAAEAFADLLVSQLT
jgi:NRPS condensation-like uncharacterized protein